MNRTVALVALALAPASLTGQGGGLIRHVGVGAGLAVPSGSFASVDKPGWLLLVTAGARIKSADVAIDGLYGQTGHDGGVEGTSTLAGAIANVTLRLGSDARRFQPFVLGGVGAVRVNIDVPGFGSAAATKLAYDFGAGVWVGSASSGRRWFVVARYISVKTAPQGTAFIPVTAGVIFPLGR